MYAIAGRCLVLGGRGGLAREERRLRRGRRRVGLGPVLLALANESGRRTIGLDLAFCPGDEEQDGPRLAINPRGLEGLAKVGLAVASARLAEGFQLPDDLPVAELLHLLVCY